MECPLSILFLLAGLGLATTQPTARTKSSDTDWRFLKDSPAGGSGIVSLKASAEGWQPATLTITTC